MPGKYVAAYPVFIVGDRPERLSSSVSVDDRQLAALGNVTDEPTQASIRRRYVTRQVQQRVHRREFRERVLIRSPMPSTRLASTPEQRAELKRRDRSRRGVRTPRVGPG